MDNKTKENNSFFESEEYKRKVRKHNDLLRTCFLTGEVVVTQGIMVLDEEIRQEIITKVREFKDFNEDNDPHQEHEDNLNTVDLLFICHQYVNILPKN